MIFMWTPLPNLRIGRFVSPPRTDAVTPALSADHGTAGNRIPPGSALSGARVVVSMLTTADAGGPELEELRQRPNQWITAHPDELTHEVPAMPLEDRAADT
jgi:hypothetical protein